MKIRDLLLAVLLLFIYRGFAFADRQLDRAEILQIFQTLTAEPRNTWISAGTIEATHLAYKASSGYMTNSTVVVKYDGEKFYWEININSHIRQTKPAASSSRDYFDLNRNKNRVFAWDGRCYTMYFKPSDRVIITENPTDLPVVGDSPLTAGTIPWGYGVYTYQELSAAESSANLDDQGQVHLTLNKIDTPEMVFILDPVKDYAVLSHSINNVGRSSISKTYGDYYREPVSGKWIPATILTERYDNSKQTPELLSHDEWNLTSISLTPPQTDSFDIAYATGTLVEYYSPVTDKPLSYHHSNKVNTDLLLQDRLAIIAAGDTQTQNCATLAMKYADRQLGMDVTDQQLDELIQEPNEGTSLYELRQFVAQGLGFYCLAAKTDIPVLKSLPVGCQAILHLPGPNHYVALGHIDDEYVWVIDLGNNKFYYRTRLDLFDLDWSEGTVLLISNEPLNNLTGNFTELSDEQLHEIIGGFPKYSCTDLIQTYNVEFCSQMIGGMCGSGYFIFYNRYGCEENENGGSCTGTDLVGNVWCVCIEDIDNPGACVVSGDWYSQYIRACK